MELKDIKDIIDLMKENDLSVFEMEKEGFKLRLQKNAGNGNGQPILAAPIALAPAGMAAPTPAAPEGGSGGGATPPEAGTKEIVSPMVGTFYRSPSPGSGPFVDVGQTVNEDTVVGIIEAMKVMNEIKAETSGVITEVAAENGKPVQFGQVLFRVR